MSIVATRSSRPFRNACDLRGNPLPACFAVSEQNQRLLTNAPVDDSLCLALVVSERRCSVKSVLLMGSSPLQALFGGDAVDGYSAASDPSPVGIQRPKPG